MIITDVKAENVLKYASLELHNLPENGVIAIDGPNESGKSTIGEILCFAFFGQTFSLGSASLEKLIRWGETHCSVAVRFRIGDDSHYEVARFLDRDGNQGARLNLVDEEEQPIAKGTESVNGALVELFGYGYDEFIESFYLAQREITTPHPHSYAVKAMAGLSTLEYVADEYAAEVEQESEAIDNSSREKADVAQELEELAIEPGLLEAMESKRDVLNAAEAESKRQMEGLREASTAYQENLPRQRATAGSRTRYKLLRFVVLILAICLLAGWALLSQAPEHPASQTLTGLLSGQFPQWGEAQIPVLLYAGIGCALLFLLLWIRVAGLNRRLSELGDVAQTLADRLAGLSLAPALKTAADQVGDSVETPVSGETGDESSGQDAQQDAGEQEVDTSVAEDERASAQQAQETEAPSRPDDAEIERVGRRIAASQASAAEVRDLVEPILSWMHAESHQRQANIVRLQVAIVDEQARVGTGQRLQQIHDACDQKLAEHQQRVHLRELAGELLHGAMRQLSQRFNRDLRDLVGRTLPLFTENRYQHLQIDENLDVRVFSNEKRDFMGLDEISSGTQRQIMLAVRLALSQKLSNSAVKGRQFVFLDEPFAFFDQERTRNALKVLPELSDDITQIWVVAQTFPGEQRFDVAIACSRDKEALLAIA